MPFAKSHFIKYVAFLSPFTSNDIVIDDTDQQKYDAMIAPRSALELSAYPGFLYDI